MKVMIVVTHLLGTGHLRRAAVLARAFADAGHRVLLASGGMPLRDLGLGGAELLQLPPVRSDGVDFARLLDRDGQAADPGLLDARRDALCSAAGALMPDILITELYPFGRRVLSGEFQALLLQVRGLPRQPLVLASVRDILAPPSTPAKAERTDRMIAENYDAVLVHSDPGGVPLEQSWPVGPALAGKLRYTGYIAPPPAGPHPDGTGAGEILVSAGGGAVGTPLFETAIRAARLMPDRVWRLLVGGSDAGRVRNLADSAPRGVIVEAARPDFRQMLTGAAASVSLCGYNTALDILQAGTPAVFVPFDDGNEVEQTLRAQSLAQLPGLTVLRTADLTPEALAKAVSGVIAAPERSPSSLRFDGAAQSVAIAVAMAQART
ncbi:glycosyltransferase [Sedimentitalea sp. JM2-8]|uniref:Glycosyltransferase n=1 Tax=Sedimentitalea xiamensis TaxID=3050037 RepID=A0ABT7FI13_9RHOB|nr:glycosyltransferase [Sedimentitalea xiamensis]MDK3074777.1 glycosyltransferase [Sedimentitalea xiamensis]